jgi:hypothetical protein
MLHIRQKNSVGTDSYTIVITDDWNEPLEQHPSIVERPEDFEIVDCEPPAYVQYLKY